MNINHVKDVIANTDNSVDILKHRSDENYLCPAVTSYVTPLRAVDVEGKWRVIVNGVKAHYETLSQGRSKLRLFVAKKGSKKWLLP